MNLIELTVTKVISQPYQVGPYTHWFIKVMAEAWGRETENLVMVDTHEEVLAVQVGYKFEG